MKKRIWFSVLLLLALLVTPVFSESPFATVFLEREAFSEGKLENLEWMQDGLILLPGTEKGVFVSRELDAPPFESMVLSWNAMTPIGTALEVEARLFHEDAQKWSDWLSWGVWRKSPEKRSVSAGDELAEISYDTAQLRGVDARATKIQIRATLQGEGIRLRRITYTLYDSSVPEREVYTEHTGFSQLPEVAYSQQIREPGIASVMCSAVTMCTQLVLSGEDLLPEEVALSQYDAYLDGFGNWSYTASFAGELGYKSYVTYADEEELLRLLDEGRAVGMSVKYSNSEGEAYPYIEGAPLSTAGHLLTVRGYECRDGERYYFVSDSAAGSDEGALLSYKGEQLMDAWISRILYVVEDKETQESSIERKEIRFAPLETEGEYILQGGIPFSVGKDFRRNAFKQAGGGIIAYMLEGDSNTYYDIQMTGKNQFRFMNDVSAEDVTVYFMSNEGMTLVAKLEEESSVWSLKEPILTIVAFVVVGLITVVIKRINNNKVTKS